MMMMYMILFHMKLYCAVADLVFQGYASSLVSVPFFCVDFTIFNTTLTSRLANLYHDSNSFYVILTPLIRISSSIRLIRLARFYSVTSSSSRLRLGGRLDPAAGRISSHWRRRRKAGQTPFATSQSS